MLATRLELRYSKQEILALHAAHAPFGGNIVGLSAATWRYYGRSPDALSWGEAALLAVLPNSPALIHPGKNREKLKAKRNRLLDRLLAHGVIDTLTNTLAKQEPLPDKPYPLPQHASHLLERAKKEGHAQKRIRSTIRLPLQQRVNDILKIHQQRLSANGIHNLADIVLGGEYGQCNRICRKYS